MTLVLECTVLNAHEAVVCTEADRFKAVSRNLYRILYELGLFGFINVLLAGISVVTNTGDFKETLRNHFQLGVITEYDMFHAGHVKTAAVSLGHDYSAIIHTGCSVTNLTQICREDQRINTAQGFLTSISRRTVITRCHKDTIGNYQFRSSGILTEINTCKMCLVLKGTHTD